MDHIAVLLEHVDLLDALDRLNVHLLQRRLELLVIGARGLVDLLDLAARSTLASVVGIQVSNLSQSWDSVLRNISVGFCVRKNESARNDRVLGFRTTRDNAEKWSSERCDSHRMYDLICNLETKEYRGIRTHPIR